MSPDDELLAEAGARLHREVAAAIEPWFVRVVTAVHVAWTGGPPSAEHAAAIEHAATAASSAVLPKLQELVDADVDEQWTTPLQVVRRAASYGAVVLAEAGVPEVIRDPMVERLAPDDVYGLEPAALADLDPELQTIGLVWGAAKAKAHLARRRRDG